MSTATAAPQLPAARALTPAAQKEILRARALVLAEARRQLDTLPWPATGLSEAHLAAMSTIISGTHNLGGTMHEFDASRSFGGAGDARGAMFLLDFGPWAGAVMLRWLDRQHATTSPDETPPLVASAPLAEALSLEELLEARNRLDLIANQTLSTSLPPGFLDAVESIVRGYCERGPFRVTIKPLPKREGGTGETVGMTTFFAVGPFILRRLIAECRRMQARITAGTSATPSGSDPASA